MPRTPRWDKIACNVRHLPECGSPSPSIIPSTRMYTVSTCAFSWMNVVPSSDARSEMLPTATWARLPDNYSDTAFFAAQLVDQRYNIIHGLPPSSVLAILLVCIISQKVYCSNFSNIFLYDLLQPSLPPVQSGSLLLLGRKGLSVPWPEKGGSRRAEDGDFSGGVALGRAGQTGADFRLQDENLRH